MRRKIGMYVIYRREKGEYKLIDEPKYIVGARSRSNESEINK